MHKVTNNQRGIAHLGLLIVAVFVFGAVGFAGVNVYKNNQSAQLSSKSNDAHVLAAKTDTKDDKKTGTKKFKVVKTPANGTIQYIVREKVTDEKGKTSFVPRGNVEVSLIASLNTKQSCRDAGKMFKRKDNVIFAGNTDADKAHKNNLGKIRVDSCTPGEYVAAASLSDTYEAVGEISKKVKIADGNKVKVTFTIKKKGADSTPADAKSQSTSTLPANPKKSEVVNLTQKQETAAKQVVSKFEADMFRKTVKCAQSDDLGEIVDIRKSKFVVNGKTYLTPALASKVSAQYASDSFQLLGISDLKCNQYMQVSLNKTPPLVSEGDGSTAKVEHIVTIKARKKTLDKTPAVQDLKKTWTYNLVKSGASWQITSIEVK